MKYQHSFNDCPYRCYSLIIINKESQKIISTTDELLNQIGYEAHEFIGRSIKEFKTTQKYIFFHNKNQKIKYECCIHHDFNNSSGLEYWLLKPIVTKATVTRATKTTTTSTILSLSQYGTIDYVYPDFYSSSLKGLPIMSFIHPDDVRKLCIELKNCKLYTTFNVRWLNQHPKEKPNLDDFTFVSLTVIHHPTQLNESCLNDSSQTRPICIIRPLSNISTTTTTINLNPISFTINTTLQLLKSIIQLIYQILDTLYHSKRYLINYSIYTIETLLDILQSILMTKSNTQLKKYKNQIHLVKVMVDNCCWTVPLLNTIIQKPDTNSN